MHHAYTDAPTKFLLAQILTLKQVIIRVVALWSGGRPADRTAMHNVTCSDRRATYTQQSVGSVEIAYICIKTVRSAVQSVPFTLSHTQHHEHVQTLPMKTEIATTFSLSVLSPLHTAQTQPALLYKADQYADRPTIQRHRTNCRLLKEVSRDTPECVQDNLRQHRADSSGCWQLTGVLI